MIIWSKGIVVKTSRWSLKKLGCIVLALCICIAGVIRSIHKVLTRMPHIEVVCDAQLTHMASEKLTAWCKQHPEIIKEPQKLIEEFNWLQSCAIRYTEIGSATLYIVAHAATAVLNESILLVKNGSIVDASYYADKPVAQFKVSERVITDHAQRTILTSCAQRMSPRMFEQYSFSWRDATACTICDKVSGHHVIADNQTVIDVKKIGIGMGLAQGKCIADIRFEQQIIVAKKRGDDEIISRC